MKSLFILLFVVVQCGWASQCNRNYGPSGVTGCVQIWRYNNEYQWATCLTNAYIQQKSAHKHVCIDTSATYCWYQCMIEVHNKNSGPVTKDCSCNPLRSTPTPYTGSPTTSLPPACYSPSGDSCDWYRNCLEKKYPCEDTSNAYAIRYAEKFCNLYGSRYSKFSPDGQKWVDAVRKCLQVSLVPLLRPWYNPTCQEIRQKAFASHTPCYLNPDKDAPSICDLSCSDYLKIFWTIKGSFIKLDTAWQSIQGMWNIESTCGVASQISKCFKEGKDTLTKKAIKITKIVIKKFKNLIKRDRRSSDPLPEADARNRFADGVGSAIARALKWNTDVMDWLAYSENVTLLDDLDTLNIVIVLADKKALGIITTSAPSVNFNQTIQMFASAIEKGKLPLQVDGYKVWVKSLASCADKACNDTQTLAVSDKPPWNGGARTGSHGNIGLFGVTAALMLFLNKLYF